MANTRPLNAGNSFPVLAQVPGVQNKLHRLTVYTTGGPRTRKDSYDSSG